MSLHRLSRKIVEANTLLSWFGAESRGCSAAHAFHNGFTVLPECHHMYHGEKVAFGKIVLLVMRNVPPDELEDIVNWYIDVGLLVTLAQLGLTEATDKKSWQLPKRHVLPAILCTICPFRSRPRESLQPRAADTFGYHCIEE